MAFLSCDLTNLTAKALDEKLRRFNENIVTGLHSNQALLDMFDDKETTLREDMSKIFIMAADRFLMLPCSCSCIEGLQCGATRSKRADGRSKRIIPKKSEKEKKSCGNYTSLSS